MEDRYDKLQTEKDVVCKWVVQQNYIEPVQTEALCY